MLTNERIAQIRKMLYQNGDVTYDIDLVVLYGLGKMDDEKHIEWIAEQIGIPFEELKQYAKQFSAYSKTLKS